MNNSQLNFACTALRELYFISNTPQEKINSWIKENKYSVEKIREYLAAMTVNKRMQISKIDQVTANELLNRELAAFNVYFPEKMAGEIRHKLAAFRLRAGMTQKQLSEEIGVRPATLSDFENGKHNLGSEKIDHIMHVLGIVFCTARP